MSSRPQLAVVPEHIWGELRQGLYDHEATCALRILQMAGPALARCNMGAFNCTALDIDCLEAFAELLYVLMRQAGLAVPGVYGPSKEEWGAYGMPAQD